MEPEKAARVFRAWAHSEGLLSEEAIAPEGVVAADIATIKPKIPRGIDLLRKGITAVAFNDASGEVVVMTRRVAPKAKKRLAELPQVVDDVPIRYRQGGDQPVGTLPTAPHGTPPFTVRVVGGSGRYTCGSSISVGNHRDAGTLGCLVRDSAGTLYGLSNNHISGSCSFAPKGLPILAPGVYDVAPNNRYPFTIGVHHAALPLVAGSPDNVPVAQNRDAAIFRITDENAVSSYQCDQYDTPAQTASMVANSSVEKCGRTTGHTKGRIVAAISGPMSIPYSVSWCNFSGQVAFDSIFAISGLTDLFSDAGDSGSLIVTTTGGQRVAVGIVFGYLNDSSAPGKKLTLALPLEPILTELAVTLVSGHNI